MSFVHAQDINVKHSPQLVLLRAADEEASQLLDAPAEQLLLRWLNYQLGQPPAASCWKEREPAADFSGDLRDGAAMAGLLQSLKPDLRLAWRQALPMVDTRLFICCSKMHFAVFTSNLITASMALPDLLGTAASPVHACTFWPHRTYGAPAASCILLLSTGAMASLKPALQLYADLAGPAQQHAPVHPGLKRSRG